MEYTIRYLNCLGIDFWKVTHVFSVQLVSVYNYYGNILSWRYKRGQPSNNLRCICRGQVVDSLGFQSLGRRIEFQPESNVL